MPTLQRPVEYLFFISVPIYSTYYRGIHPAFRHNPPPLLLPVCFAASIRQSGLRWFGSRVSGQDGGGAAAVNGGSSQASPDNREFIGSLHLSQPRVCMRAWVSVCEIVRLCSWLSAFTCNLELFKISKN